MILSESDIASEITHAAARHIAELQAIVSRDGFNVFVTEAAHAIAEKLEGGMMDADDTMLRYWRVRQLCVELHSDWEWG